MDNLALKDLQKIILGNRKEPLSAIEIRNLFSYPTTPESILYLITALNQRKLDPHTALIQAIANATKKEDLVSIGLALRYGADPNLYVNAPNIGDIHILGYTYLVLSKRDLPILNGTIIMLMIMGSNPNMLVFDTKGGIVKDEFSLIEPLKGRGVLEWLDDQGFDTIIPQIRKGYGKVDKKFMTTLATFLDKENILTSDPRLDEALGAHTVSIFNKHKNGIEIQKGLNVSMKYLNLTSFEYFIDQGAMLNYGEINDLIYLIKEYKDSGDLISMSQIRQMLLYVVQKGQGLDLYQGDLIKNFDQAIYDQIIKLYEVPYWKKICSQAKTKTPDRLKTLAYQLNLDPEVPCSIICNRIKRLLQTDPKEIKKNVIERNKNRIHSELSYINEADVSGLSCSNRSVLKTNIYDYPDADIAFYRDIQENIWCFTSNNFLKITSQKKNPYTVQEFPDYFLKDVSRKIDFISKYREMADDPTPISTVLDNINKSDIITNDYTDRYVKLFKEMGVLNGVTDWNLNNLSRKEMEKILNKNFNMTTNLERLKKDHALASFMVISYDQLKNNPDFANAFFESIESKKNEEIPVEKIGSFKTENVKTKDGEKVSNNIDGGDKVEKSNDQDLQTSFTAEKDPTSDELNRKINDESLGSSTLDESSFPI